MDPTQSPTAGAQSRSTSRSRFWSSINAEPANDPDVTDLADLDFDWYWIAKSFANDEDEAPDPSTDEVELLDAVDDQVKCTKFSS